MVLLRPKLIAINISICNIMAHIPGLGTNFPLLQAHKKIYLLRM